MMDDWTRRRNLDERCTCPDLALVTFRQPPVPNQPSE
jgi:hypothetical protein